MTKEERELVILGTMIVETYLDVQPNPDLELVKTAVDLLKYIQNVTEN